ncbi:ATP synthase F0 subunit C [Candidatus Beckwithbacteria bacterium RBG_13_42_9]|uniref:ATP synthase subunit c n=1 Tax=Candidatus Beckwithbacteria bacterium RBG_13_42_9 TaxID=1797457 RepID=A0A1F5E8N3_9BACT|nr:MAG: ATP synthase F0 subunit C [Candidatus Beckwithbacteria bacterium RBG_13_42_9]
MAAELPVLVEVVKTATFGMTIAIGGALPAVAIGKIVSSALTSIGRNPEASDKIQTVMILGVAFAEAIAIYSLVIALLIKFT